MQNGDFMALEMGETPGGFPVKVSHPFLTAVDVAPSRHCIAFAHMAGGIHLFSDSAVPLFNENPHLTAFADQPVSFPPTSSSSSHLRLEGEQAEVRPIRYDDELASFGVIPAPFSRDGTYASDWPPDFGHNVHRFLPPIRLHSPFPGRPI